MLAGRNALLNNHLVAVSRLKEGQVDEVIDNYVAQGLLVESFVLAKAFGSKKLFENVL